MLQQRASIFKDSARDGDAGGSAAALVARQSWHPDQSVERGAEGDGTPYTDLGLPVADWTELARGNHYTNDGDTIRRPGDVCSIPGKNEREGKPFG
ncbi:MAG TPA: hypothetical protein VMV90_12500 [Rectinemataceae bacterium]|nr:hypothetical protein [Rectinemataceae bacterium]